MATTKSELSNIRHPIVGLGGEAPQVSVYIANRPPLPDYENLAEYRSMLPGEIAFIASETGNHWRKVFNVFAKLAFLLDSQGYETWQKLRDQSLLQSGSSYGLFFSPPPLNMPSIKSQSEGQSCVHLVLEKVMLTLWGWSLQSNGSKPILALWLNPRYGLFPILIIVSFQITNLRYLLNY